MHIRSAPRRAIATTMLLVGVATWLVHEGSHWLAGTVLGYPMQLSPNQAWSSTPMTPAHAMAVSFAGPLVTYAQAALGYLMVRWRASLAGFAMVYMAFFMRLVATAVSVFNPNDEARVSRDLGLGPWTVPLVAVSALLVLTVLASHRLKVTMREQVHCYAVASLVTMVFVGADMLLFPKP